MTRERIEERLTLSDEERESIWKKSNGVCCHCGKRLYRKKATVDHFIPLSQGGTNRNINLVTLCNSCNQEKGELIYDPSYLKYLRKEEKEKLEGYFDSYIRSFDFFNRRNILACDRYVVELYAPSDEGRHLTKKNRDKRPIVLKVVINRVTHKDMGKVYRYYEQYLKKHDEFDSEEAARQNLEFWFRFGCLYYSEVNGEIKVLLAVTFTKLSGSKHKYSVTMFIMPYYGNTRTHNAAYAMVDNIPRYIIKEQGLTGLPVCLQMLPQDSFVRFFAEASECHPFYNGSFTSFNLAMMIDDEAPIQCVHDDIDILFKKFDTNMEKMESWLEEHPDASWMRGYVYE